MRAVVFGAGYVGLATAVHLRRRGVDVCVVDLSANRIATHAEDLAAGRDPLGEPGLGNALQGVELGVLPEDPHLVHGAVVVCAVGTPLMNGRFELSAVYDVARIARDYDAAGLVIRSTVTPAAVTMVRTILNGKIPFAVVPEFLREGHVVDDIDHPKRSPVVGIETAPGRTKHYPFVHGSLFSIQVEKWFGPGEDRGLILMPEEAALAKLAANTALSLRVWLADAVSHACEGSNEMGFWRILEAVYADERIGKPGSPGLGAAGPCLPKDLIAFGEATQRHAVAKEIAISHTLRPWHVALQIGAWLSKNGHRPQDPTIRVHGLGFKPDSPDWRDSPAVTLVGHLRLDGHRVSVYDDRIPEAERGGTRGVEPWLSGARFGRGGDGQDMAPTVLVLLTSTPLLNGPNCGVTPQVVFDPYGLLIQREIDAWREAGVAYFRGGCGSSVFA